MARQPTGFYQSLNPSTKLVIALLEVVAAFALPGWIGPPCVLAVVTATAIGSRVARDTVRISLAAVPLVVSILAVNLFLLPGATDPILRAGPLAPTWSGLWFGLATSLRLLAFSAAITVAYLTTPMDDLLADLSRRGLGRRAVFVVGAGFGMVPRTLERAGEIMDAQRARGVDTEGHIWRRFRGIVPVAGPLVLGALTEVEERTMALEARGFTAPGRRTLLRVPADSGRQRLLRWAAAATLAALVVLRVSGRLA